MLHLLCNRRWLNGCIPYVTLMFKASVQLVHMKNLPEEPLIVIGLTVTCFEASQCY